MLQSNSEADVVESHCDVTSEESVNAFIQTAVSKFGRIDHACNIAGVLMPGTSPEFSAADFDKQWSINARGMWLCQRAELAQMLKQQPIQPEDSPSPIRGAIANVASMAALRVYDNLPSYCSTKFAILGFTKADAMRYGADHIRVNAVCPGVIKTPMLGEISDDDTTSIAEMTREMALGRQGRPEEVAEALFWLTSPRSSFVTGIALPVNGGKLEITTFPFLLTPFRHGRGMNSISRKLAARVAITTCSLTTQGRLRLKGGFRERDLSRLSVYGWSIVVSSV